MPEAVLVLYAYNGYINKVVEHDTFASVGECNAA
jgi:hypothetical protein